MIRKTKMTCKRAVTTAVLLALPLVAAHAQTLFRCGKTYQDRPCEAGQESKLLVPDRAATPKAQGAADATCAQRGIDAQKIVWSREAGAMLEQQMAKARNGDERKLIADVYNKRGTSSEIRAAIEGECVIERERAMRNANAAPVPAPANDQAPPIRPNDMAKRNTGEQSSEDGMRKKMLCNRLKAKLENVRDGQRTGGDIGTMDALSREKSELEKQLRQAGC